MLITGMLKVNNIKLDNVEIGQGQLWLIINHILFTIYGGCSHFGQVNKKNLMNTPLNSSVISENPMFR